jgi:hypothetical protein
LSGVFSSSFSHEEFKIIASFLGPIVTLGGFYFLNRQIKINGENLRLSFQSSERSQQEYIKAQRWKKTEFVADQVDKFFDDKENRIILKMLDWKVRTIVIPLGKTEKLVRVDRNMLTNSLRRHSEGRRFSAIEAAIRDLMDHFLGELGRFSHYIKAGTIEKEDIDNHILYWMDLLHGRKPEVMDISTVNSIWEYIICYNFESVRDLLLLYGDRPIPPNDGKAEISEHIREEAQR